MTYRNVETKHGWGKDYGFFSWHSVNLKPLDNEKLQKSFDLKVKNHTFFVQNVHERHLESLCIHVYYMIKLFTRCTYRKMSVLCHIFAVSNRHSKWRWPHKIMTHLHWCYSLIIPLGLHYHYKQFTFLFQFYCTDDSNNDTGILENKVECRGSTLMKGVVETSSPYLYPCSIEYSLISAGEYTSGILENKVECRGSTLMKGVVETSSP